MRVFRLLAAVAIAACAEAPHPPDPGAADRPTAFAEDLPVCAAEEGAEPLLETVATGLAVPWDLAFLPDGRLLVTERPGRIRVVTRDGLRAEPWAVLDVSAEGEGGLLGIAVAPDFDRTGHVYVAATFRVGRDGFLDRIARRIRREVTPEGGYPIVTAIVRLTDRDGYGTDPTTVVDGIPAALLHVGGALRIGPRGDLWFGTGDALDPRLARSREARSGSVLHYLRAPESPRYDRRQSEVYASGFRNVQGIAWDATGTQYAIDHGPTGLAAEGLRTGRDELNRIEPGVDFGWPIESGREPAPRYRPPVLQWSAAIAPAGLDFWTDGSAWAGDAFVGALAARALVRIRFLADTPVCTQALFAGTLGRIRAVRMGPDGWLYFTTSNRDMRGLPGPDDDRVMRTRPVPADVE